MQSNPRAHFFTARQSLVHSYLDAHPYSVECSIRLLWITLRGTALWVVWRKSPCLHKDFLFATLKANVEINTDL